MTTLLRIYIPTDWPAQQTPCEWELVNASGARLQLGMSEPRHWPPAERIELVLSAGQCLQVNVLLPKGARVRTPEVIGYALEELLLDEPADEHFVIGDIDTNIKADKHTATTATPVWVIGRARLQTLLAALRSLNRQPHRLISEVQLIPLTNGWTVCLKPQTGFVRFAADEGCTFDRPADGYASPPPELALALQAAQQAERVPAAIDVLSAPGVAFDAAMAQAWQDTLGVSVRLAGEYIWRDCSSTTARNLLTGEFAPPQAPGEGWSALRPAAAIAVLALLLYSSFSFAEWAWLNHQKNQLRQQMTERFRSTFPQAQAVVNPALQMQRLHDNLRRERGQLGSGDFLPLLAAATKVTHGQGRLHSLVYEDERLEMTLIMTNQAAVESLRETLTQHGFNTALRNTRTVRDGLEAVFALRRAS